MRAFFSNIWRRLAEKRSWTGYFNQLTALMASKSKANVNVDTALSIPAMGRAVEILSRTIASLKVCVYKKEDGVIKEHINHSVYDLLKFNPSPKYNTFTFFESFVRSLVIYRRAFALPIRDRNGNVVELLFIPESEIEVYQIEAPQFEDKRLVYRISGIPGTFMDEDIIHVRSSSYDGLNSVSVVASYKETFGRGICEVDYGAAFYGNGATLSGILTTERNLTKEKSDQIRESWDRAYAGGGNVGKTGILDNGLKYEKVGTTPIDADYINSRKMSVEDISNITGVPAFLLANNDRSTFNNIEHLDRTFVNYTLGPMARNIEAEFNMKLFGPRERRKTYVQFDIRELLRGDRESMAKWYTTMFQVGAMSPNDIRENENMNPYPGGDEYFVQLNMAPTEKIEMIHTSKPSGQQKTDDNPIPEPRKKQLNGTRKADLLTTN